jgi:hypothetical protein
MLQVVLSQCYLPEIIVGLLKLSSNNFYLKKRFKL